MTTSISEMERQEHEALAALKAEFPEALIEAGCDHRYAVLIKANALSGNPAEWAPSQWWEYDTLAEVRKRIIDALAHR